MVAIKELDGFEPLYITAGGERRLIGYFNESKGLFYTEREKSKHFYNKYKGWSIDYSKIKYMIRNGLKGIILKDIEEGKIYKVTAKDFWSRGKNLSHHACGRQICLSEKYWRVEDDNK